MNKIFLIGMAALVIAGLAPLIGMYTQTDESSFERLTTVHTKDGVTVEITVAGMMRSFDDEGMTEMCKFVSIIGARTAFAPVFYEDIRSVNLHKLMVEELSKIDDGPCNITLTNVDVMTRNIQ